MNRSVTVPTRLATPSTRTNNPNAAIGEADGIETLLTIPHAKIVKFSTPSSAKLPAVGEAGTLPWATPTERTMAAGPLEIYRVPGSVSFLHSGALLHAIMRRSQCWCVDGASKFVLRVLADTYYRIDLPGETQQDLDHVEQMKLTLAKVLFYERTPCPFSRTFTVELPEEAPKATKKRRRTSGPAKKWRLQHAYSWKPEGEEDQSLPGSEDSSASGDLSDYDEPEGTVEQTGGQGSQPDLEDHEGASFEEMSEMTDQVKDMAFTTPTKPGRLNTSRSVTAPPQLTLRSTPPSKIRSPTIFDGPVEAKRVREAAAPSPLNPARLRTFQHSVPVDMPPSPPDSSAGPESEDVTQRNENIARQVHVLEASQALGATVAQGEDETEDSVIIYDAVPMEEEDSSVIQATDAVLLADIAEDGAEQELEELEDEEAAQGVKEDEVAHEEDEFVPEPPAEQPLPDDPFAQIQARIIARRSIGGSTTAFQPRTDSTSSSSSTSTLASDRSNLSRRSQAMTANQQALAQALVNKACAVFLGPPAYLVELMLRIAKKIASGALKMAPTFVVRQPQRKVPGSFHVEALDSDENVLVEGESETEIDEEDDFGVPLRSPIRLAALASKAQLRERRGWEIE